MNIVKNGLSPTITVVFSIKVNEYAYSEIEMNVATYYFISLT